MPTKLRIQIHLPAFTAVALLTAVAPVGATFVWSYTDNLATGLYLGTSTVVGILLAVMIASRFSPREDLHATMAMGAGIGLLLAQFVMAVLHESGREPLADDILLIARASGGAFLAGLVAWGAYHWLIHFDHATDTDSWRGDAPAAHPAAAPRAREAVAMPRVLTPEHHAAYQPRVVHEPAPPPPPPPTSNRARETEEQERALLLRAKERLVAGEMTKEDYDALVKRIRE